jgi:hypothetical protein
MDFEERKLWGRRHEASNPRVIGVCPVLSNEVTAVQVSFERNPEFTTYYNNRFPDLVPLAKHIIAELSVDDALLLARSIHDMLEGADHDRRHRDVPH